MRAPPCICFEFLSLTPTTLYLGSTLIKEVHTYVQAYFLEAIDCI